MSSTTATINSDTQYQTEPDNQSSFETKKTGQIYSYINLMNKLQYIGSTFNTIQQRHKNRVDNFRCWLRNKNIETSNHKLFESIYEYGFECFIYKVLEETEFISKQQMLQREADYQHKFDSVRNGLNSVYAENRTTKDEIKRQKQIYNQKNKTKIAQQRKEYGEKNKEKLRKQKKEYYENNKSVFIHKSKLYRDANKKVIAHRKRIHYQKNRTEILEKQKIYRNENKDKISKSYKKWRDQNRNKKIEQDKKYYQQNRKKLLEQQKIYRQNNKEKIKEFRQKNKDRYKCELCRYSTYSKSKYERHLKSLKHQKNTKLDSDNDSDDYLALYKGVDESDSEY